ncbi:hypothetical protein [Micromonospora sp. D93]|uniref:hypothetical protein n=1 Tax=Micromonospora sp. D93 TaxID=2824886 RepID=UPI001FFCAD51|nr:hypothetical protein [Micromonospora sp. D93]
MVQLMVSVTRRKMGGHLPVIISGGLSVLVGAALISLAGADNPTLAKNLQAIDAYLDAVAQR